MREALFAASLLLFVRTAALAESAPPPEAVCDVANAVEAAYLGNDLASLEDSVSDLAGRVGPYWARYLSALAEYRRALMVMGDEEKQAKRALNRAIDTLKALGEEEPHPEVLALLSTVYGLRIGLSPMKGMTLGSKANRAIAAALERAPENPRVALMDGIGKFNKPGMFGGDKAEARALFRRALEIFAADSSSPCWGRTSAMLWLARAELHFENRQGAKELAHEILGAHRDFAEAQSLANRLAEERAP